MKSSDIRSPPRETGQPHIHACGYLIFQYSKIRCHISGPYQRSISLRSCPCTAHQTQNIFLALCLQTFVGHSRKFLRINVACFFLCSQKEPVIVVFIFCQLWLAFIQPEQADTLIIIVLFQLLPDKCSCLRVGRIHIGILILHSHTRPHFRADQISHLLHITEVFTVFFHRRPDRDHQLDSHLFQFFHHLLRIRPEFRIELKIALCSPVKEIYNNHRDRQAAALVFPGYGEKFLLSSITQFTLPETRSIVRHHGHLSCYIGIGFLNLCRIISGGDPIIHLSGRIRRPFCHIPSKGSFPNSRIIPEKSVSSAGNCERHRNLGISL